MKRRIAIWAGVGFMIACGWVIYTFAASPEQQLIIMREPLVQAAFFLTCPVVSALRSFPLHFWWVPPLNGATYLAVGLMVEIMRRKWQATVTA